MTDFAVFLRQMFPAANGNIRLHRKYAKLHVESRPHVAVAVNRGIRAMKAFPLLAAAAMMAGPAMAADTSYDLPEASSPLYAGTSLYAGNVELAFALAKSDDSTIRQFDATGRLAGPLVGWLNGEGEVVGVYSTVDDESYSAVGVIGHFYKEEPTHALGIATGVVSMDSQTSYGIGAEGKAWLGENALTGLAAYVSVAEDDDYYVVSGQLDHYFTPDLKGAVALSYADRSDGDYSLLLASLGVEKRITGTCWSLFASGSYLQIDGTTSDSTVWGARVGARAFFDQPGTTLAQHDRLVPFNGSWLTFVAR